MISFSFYLATQMQSQLQAEFIIFGGGFFFFSNNWQDIAEFLNTTAAGDCLLLKFIARQP